MKPTDSTLLVKEIEFELFYSTAGGAALELYGNYEDARYAMEELYIGEFHNDGDFVDYLVDSGEFGEFEDIIYECLDKAKLHNYVINAYDVIEYCDKLYTFRKEK